MSKIEENAKKAEKDATFEMIVANAIKLPGVKVNRKEFLTKMFDGMKDVDLYQVLEVGTIEAGVSEEKLAQMANKLIMTRTSESSAISFAAGLPGGLAMAATIPADTLQYFGMALRLAQELTYLYGAQDLWQNSEVDMEAIQNTLIIYLGVMFGVAGASAGVRLLSSQLAKVALKKIPQKALTKTVWYPIVKQVCKAIGIKMTKNVAAKGISKAIPVIGGLVSGGLTFVSMRPMGKKLASTLDEANFHYTEAKMKKDFEEVEKLAEAGDVEEVEFEEIEIAPEFSEDEKFEETFNVVKNTEEDVFGKIEKLAKLRDMGALTEEEFTTKKTELLKLI